MRSTDTDVPARETFRSYKGRKAEGSGIEEEQEAESDMDRDNQKGN